MEELKVAQFYNSFNFNTSKKKISEILQQIDVDYCIPDTHRTYPGYTTLHFAVKRRSLDLTNELLQQGVNLLKQGTHDGCTPLHIAISNRSSLTYIRCLFEEQNFICTLLSKQIESNNSLNPANKYGLTHLHISCIVNHSQAVDFFAQAKVSLDQSISYEPSDDFNNASSINLDKYIHLKQLQGYTPLQCAVKYSSVKSAAILLRYGADIYAKNADGMSCVHLLVERIMYIIDFITMGIRKACIPYLGRMLERAEAIIKFVLKTRASDEIFVDDVGFTALHLACTMRDNSIVKDLLKKNVDVNKSVKDESKFWPGWTPLHFAACCNIETMMLLLQNGADITMKNSKGESALDLCAERFTTIDLLLVLSTRNEYKDIVLSDNETKLSDLLLAMDDIDKFDNLLLTLKDVNLTIPRSSPIWPDYNLLHLCVSLNEKKIFWQELLKKLELFEIVDEDGFKICNCTEEEEMLYMRRIELCLKSGCSINFKNAVGQSPIHLAFRLRKSSTVIKLLKYSKDNVVDNNDLSHLHIACTLGTVSTVNKYLYGGVDVNSQVKINFNFDCGQTRIPVELRVNSTPLHVAATTGDKKLIEYLLAKEADVYAKDSLDLTPIHLLMQLRCREMSELARLLFRAAPNLQDFVSKDGLSHLHVAARANDKQVVERLLLAGAQVDGVVRANVNQPSFLARLAGKTPLRVAEDANANEAIKALLAKGANVHAEDFAGVSALQFMFKRIDMDWTEHFVETLKAGKCDAEPSGVMPLHIACGRYDIDWTNKLLKEGANVNARISVKGEMEGATPLHMVFDPIRIFEISDYGDVDNLVKLLLHEGADVTIATCRGLTPLLLAYAHLCSISKESYGEQNNDNNHNEQLLNLESEVPHILKAMDLLLDAQKSYDVNPTDPQGFSHFHFACIRNKVEIVKNFLDHGVDVNQSIDPFAPLTGGFSPLHFALAHGSKEVVYLLLQRGHNLNAEDANANTPIHTAIKKRFVDLPSFKTMLRYGANVHVENLREETQLFCLLKSSAVTFQALEFFLDNGSSINILNITDNYCQKFIVLAMRNLSQLLWQQLTNKFTQVPEVREAIQNGFNMIQSIITIQHNGELSVDKYLKTIECLLTVGWELDQQDSEGRTALHTAVTLYNLEALKALLKLGADLDIADNLNERPLSDKVIAAANASNDSRKINVITTLIGHVWKMKFVGFDLKNFNLRSLEKLVKNKRKVFFAKLFQKPCQNELMEAEKIRLGPYLTVKDFLSENAEAVLRNRPMNPTIERHIYSILGCSRFFRRRFPLLSGVLALRYRKFLEYVRLLQDGQ